LRKLDIHIETFFRFVSLDHIFHFKEVKRALRRWKPWCH